MSSVHIRRFMRCAVILSSCATLVGYDAMMAGKSSVVAGALNRWMMRGVRLVPRSFAAAQAGKLNRDK